MTIKKLAVLSIVAITLSACTSSVATNLITGRIIKDDVTVDAFPGVRHSVSEMKAGIWIDGNRCEHWIIDDGIEGYMSPRYNNDLPVCNDDNIPYTTRDFNRSSWGSESINSYN